MIFNQKDYEHFLNQKGFNIFGHQKIKDLPKLPEELWNFSEEQKESTLFLIGSGGKELWEILKGSTSENPFDDYSKETAHLFSQTFFNQVPHFLYPDHQTHFPLQRLSRLLGLTSPTPLGIDIHPEYGVWFGLRALFLISGEIPHYVPTLLTPTFPCDTCESKDCLKGKSTDLDFDEARRRCPYQSQYQYTPEQLDFHHKQTLRIKKFNN